MKARVRAAKYDSLYKFLRTEVAEGRYAVGDQLPTEVQLGEMCQVSRTTIRSAVNQLVEEGVLSRQQGRGTFVIALPQKGPESSPYEAQAPASGKLAVHFRPISAGPSRTHPEIATLFGLTPDAPVFHIERVRLLDGEPVAIKRYYAPTEAFAKAPSETDLASRAFDTMLQSRSVYIARTNISAKPIFVGERDADLLNAAAGCLGLFSQRIGYNQDHRIIRVSETVLAAERATLRWTIRHPYGQVPSSEVVNLSDWMSNALE